MVNLENKNIRDKRKKQTAEVFTPNKLVNEMLNKFPEDAWKDEEKTFCDPACGNGQFLIWVLIRKLQQGQKALVAIKTIFGVDIMIDNIRECRMRLLKTVSMFEEIKKEHIAAVFKRIIWINSKKYPNGSLDYDFSFKNRVKKKDVGMWMDYIYKDNVLDNVELPVPEEVFERKDGYVDIFE